jgi:hypothetical protein
MNSHETNREGRKIVEAELLRRGAGSVISSGTRKVYLHASNRDGSRTVQIRVKTKRKENWHSTIVEANPVDTSSDLENENSFWVFVDLGSEPRFWIVPDWWIRNDIYEKHERYLEEHDGRRPINDDSDHHSIDENRLEEWQDKWEILKIFSYPKIAPNSGGRGLGFCLFCGRGPRLGRRDETRAVWRFIEQLIN